MRIGSLFTGYAGLDIAVQKFFGGEMVWYSEIDKAACTVIEAHHPTVPNLGDITKVDWSSVEKIDVLTGGYPCQPFSHAGKRKGKKDERHLWPYVRDAISALGPTIVVLENVAGHISLGLADVIGDLAHLGYDARWGVVRASDAGAPHQRARVFIVAFADGAGFQGSSSGVGGASTGRCGYVESCACKPVADPSGERYGGGQGSDGLGGMVEKITENGCGCWETNRARQEFGTRGVENRWGQYESAIRRWEHLTRPAPNPTTQHNERTRLNPVFVEWMMGLREGHVTGHGLSNAQALKMLGNGVVPQQAVLALSLLSVLPESRQGFPTLPNRQDVPMI